jgi:hypothetical protein
LVEPYAEAGQDFAAETVPRSPRADVRSVLLFEELGLALSAVLSDGLVRI